MVWPHPLDVIQCTRSSYYYNNVYVHKGYIVSENTLSCVFLLLIHQGYLISWNQLSWIFLLCTTSLTSLCETTPSVYSYSIHQGYLLAWNPPSRMFMLRTSRKELTWYTEQEHSRELVPEDNEIFVGSRKKLTLMYRANKYKSGYWTKSKYWCMEHECSEEWVPGK